MMAPMVTGSKVAFLPIMAGRSCGHLCRGGGGWMAGTRVAITNSQRLLPFSVIVLPAPPAG
jgi:hypothetical protein